MFIALLRTSTIPAQHANAYDSRSIFVVTSVIEKSLDVSGDGPEGNIGLQRIEIASEECAKVRAGFLLAPKKPAKTRFGH